MSQCSAKPSRRRVWCTLAVRLPVEAELWDFRVLVAQSPVPCCGGFAFHDVALMGRTSDAEFELVNTAKAGATGSVDAFLVPTSCARLKRIRSAGVVLLTKNIGGLPITD